MSDIEKGIELELKQFIEKGIELELKQFKGHYINLVKCEKRYLDLGLGFNKNYRKL